MTEDEVRRIAREEAERAVSSLSGLVMRRAQEIQLTRSSERNTAERVVQKELSEIFGEALQQFSDKKWPGGEVSRFMEWWRQPYTTTVGHIFCVWALLLFSYVLLIRGAVL